MTTPPVSAPRLLFRTAFAHPVWRIRPAPGALGIELRDATAGTVSFKVLAAADGRELLHFHDSAAPWWLSLADLTPTALVLNEHSPDQLGLPIRQRYIAFESEFKTLERLPATLGIPATHLPDSPFFGALARFVAARAERAPLVMVEYLEFEQWLILAFDRAGEATELLICHAETGAVVLRADLGATGAGPDATVFCTFGPILYALGAPGEVFAWHLSAA